MLILLLAPPALALAITGTTCTVQADNILRYDCVSTTDINANSWIRFCEGASCSPLSRTSTDSPGVSSHNMTIYNLKPGTTYTYQGVASTGGSPVYQTPVSTFTTGSLPAELANISFTPSGTAGPLLNILFPFADQQYSVNPNMIGS